MNLREAIPLAPLTTFRMGPRARYIIEIASPEDLRDAFAFIHEEQLPFCVLGGGSNVIFTQDNIYEGVVLHMNIRGFDIAQDGEDENGMLARVGAGEDWDAVVRRTVEAGLSGIEALSAIPGTAGATPIQNVGAYGREVADVLESVDVYDYTHDVFSTLTPGDCRFAYRDSRFKHEQRYVITGITLGLSRKAPGVPEYPGVQAYFEEHGTEPTLASIREAVVSIRKTKLPDPTDIASCGSFFKNPIVSSEIANRLTREFENPVLFPQPDGRYKVGAGWLIDTLGLKGQTFGHLSLYPHNALVLTNDGHATYAELQSVISDIQGRVRDRFGITLEPEPVFI